MMILRVLLKFVRIIFRKLINASVVYVWKKLGSQWVQQHSFNSFFFSDSVSGKGILSGHIDGAIVRYFFDDEGTGLSQVSFLSSKSIQPMNQFKTKSFKPQRSFSRERSAWLKMLITVSYFFPFSSRVNFVNIPALLMLFAGAPLL